MTPMVTATPGWVVSEDGPAASAETADLATAAGPEHDPAGPDDSAAAVRSSRRTGFSRTADDAAATTHEYDCVRENDDDTADPSPE
jgi:hypothetical protein